MNIALNFNTKSGITAENGFFLQGNPVVAIGKNGGTGVTDGTTPGIYYSWPQLDVTGSLTVGGITYEVVSGLGWIDHQLMMSSLTGSTSIPFVDDYKPFNGWLWQYFNLDNGDAFTCAAFQQGAINDNPAIPYGYYVTLNEAKTAWDAFFISGEMTISNFQSFPVPAVVTSSSLPTVSIPLDRSYENLQNIILGNPLAGMVNPWFTDGTFNGSNWALLSEIPSDYVDTSGNHPNGVGYSEAVGFESVDNYRARALNFLVNGVYPGGVLVEHIAAAAL